MVIRDSYLLQRSAEFTLEPRQEASVDLSLEKVPVPFNTCLSGRVVDKCGPIKGATVKAFNISYMPITHTFTDCEGKFAFVNILPTGVYKIIATANEYQVSSDYNISLSPYKPYWLTIKLRHDDFPLGTVYGDIYDRTNTAISDAEISIVDYYHPNRLKALTQSNSDGEYLVYGLNKGKYLIAATKEGFVLPEKIIFVVDLPEIIRIDLYLYEDVLSRKGTISGKALYQGEAISHAVVALYKIEGTNHSLIEIKQANSDGVYLFSNVFPGEYIVKAKLEDHFEEDHKAKIE